MPCGYFKFGWSGLWRRECRTRADPRLPPSVSRAAIRSKQQGALDALKRGRLSGFKLNRIVLIPRDAIDRLAATAAARLREWGPMGETTRGPPAPNAKPLRSGGKARQRRFAKSTSVSSATIALDDGGRQEKSFNSPDSVTELERLRAVKCAPGSVEAETAPRLQGGARVTVELFLLFAELLGAEGLLWTLAPRFGGFDQSFLGDRVGHEFPPRRAPYQ